MRMKLVLDGQIKGKRLRKNISEEDCADKHMTYASGAALPSSFLMELW
jgi:hypothetical protein